MFSTLLHAATRAARRIPLSLGLLALLLMSALGPPIPARASDHPRAAAERTALFLGGDPAARIQVNLISITVVNDRDGTFRGSGELSMEVSFWRCSGPSGPCASGDGGPAVLMAKWFRDFSADSGDFKDFERVMPVATDVVNRELASEDGGLVLHDGGRYVFQVNMFERDTTLGDFMGGIQDVLDESNQFGLGLHMQEPARPLLDKSIVSDPVCGGCGGVLTGDYLVTYEVVRAALPDLQPIGINVLRDAATNQDAVCLDVLNSGLEDAGPFSLSLLLDGFPVPDVEVSVAGLAKDATQESCIRMSLPTTGSHAIAVYADSTYAIPEMNERNNLFLKTVDFGPVPASPTPLIPNGTGSTPGPRTSPSPVPIPVIDAPTPRGKADLSIGAIKVNGQVPDGKNDCKDGKNSVSVVVKNGGKEKSDAVAVRLSVDGAEVGTQSMKGLEAGKEREVRFEDVRLKKGEHKLAATVADQDTVAASHDDHNELSATARCTSDE